MARAAAENCMLCGQNHTGQCGGQPVRPKIQRAKKPSPPPAPPTSAAPAGTPGKVGPSEDTGSSEPELFTERARPNLSSVQRVRDPHDAAVGRALTIFATQIGIHHEDLTRYRDLIDLPDYKIDAMIWRQVNDETVQQRR